MLGLCRVLSLRIPVPESHARARASARSCRRWPAAVGPTDPVAHSRTTKCRSVLAGHGRPLLLCPLPLALSPSLPLPALPRPSPRSPAPLSEPRTLSSRNRFTWPWYRRSAAGRVQCCWAGFTRLALLSLCADGAIGCSATCETTAKSSPAAEADAVDAGRGGANDDGNGSDAGPGTRRHQTPVSAMP